ncbi:MAG: CNNM domain-containing protein [Bacteroidota bacterium]
MGLLVTYAILAIFFSFLCSVWEAVLLSMPDSFVEIKAAENDPIAPVLRELKDDVSKPLSAILSLNTIAHTVGAILVGDQAAAVFDTGGFNLFGIEVSYTGIIAAVMTLGVLLLSEIIPKSWGANNWKGLAGFTAKSLKIIMFLMYPLVRMSQFLTDRIGGDAHGAKVSRAEMSAMAQMGTRDGVFEAGEFKIIDNLMRFQEIETRSIMTPRTVVKAANQELTISEFYHANSKLPFSRIPVFEGSKDQITGFVLKDEILENLVLNKGSLLLKEIARPITVVKDDMDIKAVFNKLLSSKEHIALVVGQFGGMAGIITFEDVIETLLGLEITDELDNTVDMQNLARQNWEKRAKRLGLIEEGGAEK